MGPRRDPGEGERRELLERVGAEPGLCARCRHLELIASRRSVFVRCRLSATDPRFPRYPPLPVASCAGFEDRAKEA